MAATCFEEQKQKALQNTIKKTEEERVVDGLKLSFECQLLRARHKFKFTSKSDSLVVPFNLGPSHLLPLTLSHIPFHYFRQHPFAPSHSASQNPGSGRNRVKR
ncbi:hypothetical protein VNO80_09079 [Phaseolus coccineus]|uniref:Uncharacterized protein n=1 Tax=Phaseolus coccineus TaxID=3886 RepID=A0AAN9RC57_PHACN